MEQKTKEMAKDIFIKCTIATLCLACIFAISIFHSKSMDQKISDLTKTYLLEISMQTSEAFENEIEGDFHALETLSRRVGSMEDLRADKIMEILRDESGNTSYEKLGFVSSNGNLTYVCRDEEENNHTSYRRIINVSDREYFKKAMQGETNLSDKLYSKIDYEITNIYATPIYRQDKIVGALIAFRDNAYFSKLMNADNFDGEGRSYVVNSEGSVVFKPEPNSKIFESPSIVEAILKGWYLENDMSEQLRTSMIKKERNVSEFSSNGTAFYLAQTPFALNDWTFISIISTNTAEVGSQGIGENLVQSFFYIMVIILAIVAYMTYIRKQNVKQLESRIEEQTIHDTSYRIIMEQTNEIIFEYNPIEKTYFYTTNFKKTFGYEPTKKGFLGALQIDYIHPDDIIRYVEIFDQLESQKGLVDTEIRIIKDNGEYIWTRIHMTGVFDAQGNMVRVIGKIVDIDETMQKIDTLEKKAILDSATGVYNKQTTEDMIDAFLRGEGKHGKHALFIIDIDDFKGINDDHGHRKGDMILLDLANEISKLFRTSDIKGRIGGDEFMVLVKNIDEMGFIVDKAKTICKIFEDKNESKHIKVSTCIGIALYDKDGDSYEELYEAADKALYACKNLEKGTFAFYDDESH